MFSLFINAINGRIAFTLINYHITVHQQSTDMCRIFKINLLVAASLIQLVTAENIGGTDILNHVAINKKIREERIYVLHAETFETPSPCPPASLYPWTAVKAGNVSVCVLEKVTLNVKINFKECLPPRNPPVHIPSCFPIYMYCEWI